MRLGNMYGPDATFAGVPAADLDDPASFAGARAVIIGAPFDGGTSHRLGCRFGPQAIRSTDYLPHDGMRPQPGARRRPADRARGGRRGRRRDAVGRHRAVAAPGSKAAVETVARSGADPGRARR